MAGFSPKPRFWAPSLISSGMTGPELLALSARFRFSRSTNRQKALLVDSGRGYETRKSARSAHLIDYLVRPNDYRDLLVGAPVSPGENLWQVFNCRPVNGRF